MPILVFHSPVFIYIPLAWKWPDKAITMALCFLLLPYLLPTYFIIRTPSTLRSLGKVSAAHPKQPSPSWPVAVSPWVR